MSHSCSFTLVVPGLDVSASSESASDDRGLLAKIAGRGRLRLRCDRRDAGTALRPWERGLVDALDDLRSVRETDLFILISARKGATSYLSELDNLPAKLEKYFASNNLAVIFPQQFNEHQGIEDYSDFNAEPLHIGIDAVQKIGKTLGNMFKKEEPARRDN